MRDGVKFYTSGQATVTVFFAEHDLRCCNCEYCYAEEAMKRYRCRLTRNIVFAPFDDIPLSCPIKFEKEDEQHG